MSFWKNPAHILIAAALLTACNILLTGWNIGHLMGKW